MQSKSNDNLAGREPKIPAERRRKHVIYRFKKDLLNAVMDCMETGSELIVYEQNGKVGTAIMEEGFSDDFERQGTRTVLYRYKFDIVDYNMTTEDAEYELDQWLEAELAKNNVEVL